VTPRVVLRIEAPAWRRRLPTAGPLVRRAAGAALSAAKPRRRNADTGALCVVLADDRLQRRLNRTFRGKDKPTNVLSFEGSSAGPHPASLGDVVLALETIAGEAKQQGKSLGDHVAHLVVHGVLHLMGYDHEKRGEALRMERLEREILAGLDIADPYGADPNGDEASVPPRRSRRREA
jgi:probable rRNA maturation factor